MSKTIEKPEELSGATAGAATQEVSTGNNGTEATQQEVATQEEQDEEPGDIKEDTTPNPLLRSLPNHNDNETYYLTVDQVDPTVYQNFRDEFDPVKLLELRHSFAHPAAGKETGQIMEISVSLTKDESGATRVGVSAGYTRTEAFVQNVHDPLIKKWNREHGFKSADANFLLVTNPTHREMVRNAYPKLYAREKNRTRNLIRANFQDQDKRSAMITCFKENYERSDFTVQQLINAIETMISEGLKQVEISKNIKGMGKSEISYYRKVGRIPAALERILVTPEANETMSESDLTKLKETAQDLITEFKRRMGLRKNNEEAISISHLKEFAYSVVFDEGETLPLTRVQILKLVCMLVGADPTTMKIPKAGKKSPANYNIFVNQLKMLKDETKAAREGKVAVPEVTNATDTPEGIKAGTVEGLAAQQEAGTKSVEATTDKVDAAASAAEANADVKLGTVAPGSGTTTTATSVSDATTAALVGADAADLAALNAADDDEPEGSVSGAVSTGKRSQVAPGVHLRLKSADLIFSAIETYKQLAMQEETEDSSPDPFMACGALGSVILGLNTLSLHKEEKLWQRTLETYAQQFSDYVSALEDFSEKAGKKAKMTFTDERPMLVLAGLVSDKASGDASDIADVFGDEDDALPSDEDLEAIEGLTDDALDNVGEEVDE